MTTTTQDILALRGPKNPVDPLVPYAFCAERERSRAGSVEPTNTIFLTNRECPFRCLMCDLWRNTLDHRVPQGAIPAQIDHALQRLPPATQLKLYNSGNFFDEQAIPPEDYAAIADRAKPFRTLIVENHPRFCGPACLRFHDLLGTELEIAIGLETANPAILPRLNKHMTLADFDRAAEFLTRAGIRLRAFILLRPPYQSQEEGLEWAVRSVQHAFERGADCCSIIPTRGGNGVMERLAAVGDFAPPSGRSLETALERSLLLAGGRVFVDLWDAERFFPCSRCRQARIARLDEMNLSQQALPRVACECEDGP